MDLTQVLLGTLGVVGTTAAGGALFILTGLRGRLDALADDVADLRQTVGRLEGRLLPPLGGSSDA